MWLSLNALADTLQGLASSVSLPLEIGVRPKAMAGPCGQEAISPGVIAGAPLLLLIVNIRNAWDLTLTMVRRN